MKFVAGSMLMTVVLALLTSLGPLSTDMYLPSLPSIGAALQASTAEVQFTLSFFLVGFAGGQLIYGPLSDRFGRKSVLLAGLSIFAFASVACMMATSIELLIAARFVQAIGACSAVVLARAIVRDIFEGKDAARVLSQMGAVMGVVPAIGPVLGGMVQNTLGWQANFAVCAFLAVVLWLVVKIGLPETLAEERRGKWSFARMVADFTDLLRHKVFRRYALTVCFGYAGLFAFISGSSFVLQRQFGLSVLEFGFSFALAVLGYIAGTLIGARLSRVLEISQVVVIGTLLLAVGGLVMVGLVELIADNHVWEILGPMLVVMMGVGLTLPQSMAGALTPFPEKAGTASSLMGFCQMSFAAIIGICVGHVIDVWPNGLAWSIALMGIGAFLTNAKSCFKGNEKAA